MAGLSVATITKATEGAIAYDMQVIKARLASIENEIKGLRNDIRRLANRIDGMARSSSRTTRTITWIKD